MLILSEYTKNKKDVLYDSRASLPSLPTTNVWSYVPHTTRIRVQFQHLLTLGFESTLMIEAVSSS